VGGNHFGRNPVRHGKWRPFWKLSRPNGRKDSRPSGYSDRAYDHGASVSVEPNGNPIRTHSSRCVVVSWHGQWSVSVRRHGESFHHLHACSNWHGKWRPFWKLPRPNGREDSRRYRIDDCTNKRAGTRLQLFHKSVCACGNISSKPSHLWRFLLNHERTSLRYTRKVRP